MAKGELWRKGILYQEDGIFILRQSMPYPLAENNVLLTESVDGWTVVDVGVDLPLTRQVWEQALQEIGITFKHIHRIMVTHCHPDHLGAAAWLQRQTGAPVYMLAEEIKRASEFIFYKDHFAERYGAAIAEQVKSTGFSPVLTDQLIDDWHREVAPLYPAPAELMILEPEAGVEMQGEVYQVIPAPVHADGQFILWNSKRRLLLGADLISRQGYLHFSDWPNTHQQNPLQNLFDLHHHLSQLDISKVIPGHGPVFREYHYYMDKLVKRHHKKLDNIQNLINQPTTPAQLYPRLYDLIDYVHLHRVAIGETAGYLEMLRETGRLICFQENGSLWYAPML